MEHFVIKAYKHTERDTTLGRENVRGFGCRYPMCTEEKELSGKVVCALRDAPGSVRGMSLVWGLVL